MSSDNEDDLLQQRITESLIAWITAIMKEQIDQARREGFEAAKQCRVKSEISDMAWGATYYETFDDYLKSKKDIEQNG